MNTPSKQLTKQLAKAIKTACKRRRSEDTPTKMALRVVTDFGRVALVGRYNGQTYISVNTAMSLHIDIVDSYRIGKNPGDDFFELKLVPELGSVVALLEYADEGTFIEIKPIDIVVLFKPKDVLRIIQLIESI